jgi:parallel beta-helix repeat protein
MKMNDLIANRKMLAVSLVALFLMSALLIVAPVRANPGTLYVDAAGVCGGNFPCYLHPQDAVNNANPGDTILVYPGTYNSRGPYDPGWPGPSCSDQWAPALIVYKDDLTIKSVEGPANTIIQSTHVCWSNAIAVVHSTATTTIHGSPIPSGWAPNAIVVVASNTVIDGFTLHRPYTCSKINDCFYNTAGVMIGAKGAGYDDYIGKANGNTVKNSVFENVWHAVYIWHSSGNKVLDNTVKALGSVTTHWAAISIYDGGVDVTSDPLKTSRNNEISRNILADKGISVGAWAPTPVAKTDNSGTVISGNSATEIGIYYSNSANIRIADNTLAGGKILNAGGSPTIQLTNPTVSGNTVPGLPGWTGNGIQLFYLSGGTIADNVVSGRTANGIALLNSGDVLIKGNTATGNGASGIVLVNSHDIVVKENTVSHNAGNAANPGGITIREGVGNAQVLGNTIESNTQYGVWISSYALAGNVMHCNKIVDNGFGVHNNWASPVDAVFNWWGDVTGPYHPALNPTGLGDTVSDNVQFVPWKTAPEGIVASIDIKPGSWPNSVNTKAKGVLPVAIFSSVGFDATQVDPTTVTLLGAAPDKWSLEDIDGDGKLDLILHFEIKSMNFAGLGIGEHEVTLTGTYLGFPFSGTDIIRIVK